MDCIRGTNSGDFFCIWGDVMIHLFSFLDRVPPFALFSLFPHLDEEKSKGSTSRTRWKKEEEEEVDEKHEEKDRGSSGVGVRDDGFHAS